MIIFREKFFIRDLTPDRIFARVQMDKLVKSYGLIGKKYLFQFIDIIISEEEKGITI